MPLHNKMIESDVPGGIPTRGEGYVIPNQLHDHGLEIAQSLCIIQAPT